MSGQVGVVDNLFSSLDLNKTESRAKTFSVGLMVWLELPLRANNSLSKTHEGYMY